MFRCVHTKSIHIHIQTQINNKQNFILIVKYCGGRKKDFYRETLVGFNHFYFLPWVVGILENIIDFFIRCVYFMYIIFYKTNI